MATNGQDNKGPSIAELQRFVREKAKLEFWLSTGKSITGTLRWFDEHCFSLVQDDNSTITLTKSGVVGYKQSKSATTKQQPTKK
jgi:sRNA-binding regulator protein Hfq